MKSVREIYDELGARLSYLKGEKGQTLIEYILIIVVVALAIIVAYETVNLENTISTTLVNVDAKLNAP